MRPVARTTIRMLSADIIIFEVLSPGYNYDFSIVAVIYSFVCFCGIICETPGLSFLFVCFVNRAAEKSYKHCARVCLRKRIISFRFQNNDMQTTARLYTNTKKCIVQNPLLV